jgi:hypothetical protein
VEVVVVEVAPSPAVAADPLGVAVAADLLGVEAAVAAAAAYSRMAALSQGAVEAAAVGG